MLLGLKRNPWSIGGSKKPELRIVSLALDAVCSEFGYLGCFVRHALPNFVSEALGIEAGFKRLSRPS